MKISDLNGHINLDESLLGDFGKAFVQKTTGQTVGRGIQSQMAKNSFVKDFVDDALSGLQDAIESGIVDPNIQGQGTQVDPGTVQPDQGQQQQQQQQQPQQGKQKPSKEQRQKSIQQFNNYIKKISQSINAETNVQEKMKRIKEVVNVMADRKDYPEWDNAKAAVEKIIKQSEVDGAFAGSALKRLETGKTMTESWRVYFINQLLEQTNFTWDNLGIVVLKENKNYFIANKNFYKLDTIFESLLSEQPNKKSVTQWLTNWFTNYTKGINLSDYKSDIDSMIAAVQWPAKKAKPALEKLGKAAWSIAKEQGADKVDGDQSSQTSGQTQDSQQAQTGQGQQTQPAQAQAGQGQQTQPAQAQPAQAGQGQQAKPSVNVDELYQKIKDAVTALKQQDPASFQALVKELEK